MTNIWQRRSIRCGEVETSYLEAGEGSPLVLLHGGEFGGSAEFSWERVIAPLAEQYRVIAPDIIGFGRSSKVVDFSDGRGWRLRHLAGLCSALGIDEADFVGNSMGGAMLLADLVSDASLLPIRRLVSVCGGGELEQNEHMAALMDYDASWNGMRRIVEAMFHDPSYASDEDYVTRRFSASQETGAWEAVAAARFRRPGHKSTSGAGESYDDVVIPVLLVEGDHDKLKPSGWAGRLAERIPGAAFAVIADSGHCPQIEQPEAFVRQLTAFLSDSKGNVHHD